jgi:riboflavin synthase
VFSGIIQGRGLILESSDSGGDRKLVIGTAQLDLGAIAIGDSIAVNGVCLTVTAIGKQSFAADVSAETLACTTLGRLKAGDPVNLEGSLRLGQPIAGHLVYGHVDGVGKLVDLTAEARSVRLTIRVPPGLSRYIAPKGSVTIDGVSLTVNAVDEDRFTVNIIPHTREITVISGYAQGTPVNIEVDMIARYLERLVAPTSAPLDLDTLKRHGFIESD